MWTEFKLSRDLGMVDNNKVIIKLFNGKVISNYRIVGVTLIANKNEDISYSEIGWFQLKKDWNRYNNLQRHHTELNKYDDDTLNDFEWAILDNFEYGSEDYKKVETLFKKLLKYKNEAQENIIKESKSFIN